MSEQLMRDSAIDDNERHGFVPHYQRQSIVRAWLKAVDGVSQDEYRRLVGEVLELLGTPQAQKDWSDPGTWIVRELTGRSRELALSIWSSSSKLVNPRYMNGAWWAAARYGLLTNTATLQLTDAGRDFIDHPHGDTVRTVDQGEGLLVILGIVSERGPGKRGDFLAGWKEHVLRTSNYRADGVIAGSLSDRLRDLLDRQLVEKQGQSYSITQSGIAYLAKTGPEGDDVDAIRRLTDKVRRDVIAELANALSTMDPIKFEVLIKRLLEEMGYDDVEVTPPSGDGGVDVIASIEMGITSVREVVQVKRRKGSVPRKDLDALRGSLHRFGAVRGTLITTGNFAKGAREAAFDRGAAPITLIDGDKLVELLIANGIGVKRRSIELLELDLAALTDNGTEEAPIGE